MRPTVILLLWASLAAPSLASVNETAAQIAINAALESSHVPGMGAVVIRDRHLAAIAVGGITRMDKTKPVKASDPWLIGSNAKPMTAAMILRLVEQSRLSLDARLEDTDPGLAVSAQREYRAITLRQMLTHTSGLPHDYHDLAKVAVSLGGHGSLPEQRLTYLGLALKDPPVAPPGKSFHYSNTGFILAAAIAERATGLSYEQLMQREIFEPLGMRGALVGLPPADGNHGHTNGKPAAPPDEIPPMMNPAGGISLSLSAWAEFCIDQLDGAKGHGRLLTAANYKLMQSPQPESGNGLDWGYDASIGHWQGPVLEHTGSDGAWMSLVVLFPASGNGLLVNANAGSSMGGESADKSVLRALLPLVAHQVTSRAGQ